MTLTHEELVERAAQFARQELDCYAVVVDTNRKYRGEHPDVFGVAVVGTYNIECKTTLADFRADQRKSWTWCGNWRYYFAPSGVIPLDAIEKKVGLIAVNSDRDWIAKDAQRRERSETILEHEITILAKEVQRLHLLELQDQIDRIGGGGKGPIKKRLTDLDLWLSEIKTFVEDSDGCWASLAIRACGTHTFGSTIKAIEAVEKHQIVDSELMNGKLFWTGRDDGLSDNSKTGVGDG